jgi:ligand-binding SRPBCC domain-containing protein
MQVIRVETRIVAPAERCFRLSLSIDLHMQSTTATDERAISGVTTGLIGLGESVTWRGRHFGLMLQQTSKITLYEAPTFFQDVMTDGMFKSFEHDHRFEERNGLTLMSDELRFAAPLGLHGKIVERVVLPNYLTRFLAERNEIIKQTAESEAWRDYLGAL